MARKKQRAVNGSGSVVKLEGGRYRAFVPVGYGPDGKLKRLSKRFDTLREADAWRMEMVLERDKGTLVLDSGLTVAGLIDLWDESNTEWSVASRQDMVGTLRRHVAPHIGEIKAHDLRPAHVQQLMNTLAATPRKARKAGGAELPPLPASSRHRVLKRLKACLEFGVSIEAVQRNAAARVMLPAVPPKKRKVWGEADVAKVVSAAFEADSVYGRYFVVALLTGLRKEELRGLRWQDVDLVARTVTVAHVVVDEGALVARERTKTDAGYRVVHFDDVTLAALSAQAAAPQVKPEGQWAALGLDLVFRSRVGGPLRDVSLRKHLRVLAAAAGVSVIRLYDTRSSHGTVLAARGVNPKAISERLGHTDVAFTMKTYVRPAVAEDRAIAELMGGIVSSGAAPGAVSAELPLTADGADVAPKGN